ncbi:MAG TPA: DUF364 domain-containing protein [Clostridium sp.]
MLKVNFYEELFNKFREIVIKNDLLEDKIITGKILTPVEAIGDTEKKNYPILKGKERLLEVTFRGYKGQAFTDMLNNYSGTLKEVIEMPLDNNFNRAVYIATLNAVCRYLNISSNTVHCKDKEPGNCALELPNFIKERYGNPKIALIGFQPAMLEKLSKSFDVRIVDLDINNINTVKYGVLVEDGYKHTESLLEWCDIILATGSTVANNTITSLFVEKPIVFFGTTLAGTAELMGLERFCPCSK